MGLLAASAVMFVKALLPITFLDFGVRENVAIFFYGLLGVGASSALAGSLMLFLWNVALPGLVGLYFFLTHRHDKYAHVPSN